MGLIINTARGEVSAMNIEQLPLLVSVFADDKVQTQKQIQKHTRTQHTRRQTRENTRAKLERGRDK